MDSSTLPRRFHSKELKARVLAACAEPGASIAAVALAHGLNANLVHKWRRRQRVSQALSSSQDAPVPQAIEAAPDSSATTDHRAALAAAFVPVALPARVAPEIRLELQRGAARVSVTWPVQEAAACGAWLRQWLR